MAEDESPILAFLERHFFLESLICAILLAWAYPPAGIKNGDLQMQITGKWIAVSLIFLISGVKLKTQELLDVFKSWQQNLYVQSNIFITFPLVTWIFSLIFKSAVSDPLREGLIIMGNVFTFTFLSHRFHFSSFV